VHEIAICAMHFHTVESGANSIAGGLGEVVHGGARKLGIPIIGPAHGSVRLDEAGAVVTRGAR